jgi:MarR family multiple gene transcriptional regulator MgrA
MIHDSIRKKANYELNNFDITLSQCRILDYLYERQNIKTSQKDIEEHYDVTHPTVIGILKRMKNKGFVITRSDDEDKRFNNICLTSKGETIHQKMSGFQNQMEQNLLKGLTDNQVQELKRYLKIISNNLQD